MTLKPVWIVDTRDDLGFTLMEMIMVILILSVLASLAFPKFYDIIEFSRSSEALKNLGTLRSSMDRCFAATQSYADCIDLTELDIGDPSTYANSHFSYSIDTADDEGFSVIVTRKTFDGGDGTSTILYTYTQDSITKSGTGSFQGIK